MGVTKDNAEQRDPSPQPSLFDATIDPVEFNTRKIVSPEHEMSGSSEAQEDTRTRIPPQIKSLQMKKLRKPLFVLLTEKWLQYSEFRAVGEKVPATVGLRDERDGTGVGRTVGTDVGEDVSSIDTITVPEHVVLPEQPSAKVKS